MLIVYFDEVKYQEGNQPYYWLGAIVASAEDIWAAEAAMSVLSERCFGAPHMSRDTEFHAADIFHRKRAFKGWSDIDQRLDVLKELAAILDRCKDIGKVRIRIDPNKMIRKDYEEVAFVFLVEKVEQYLRAAEQPGILIGDRENERVSQKFAEMLSKYRATGTPYQFGVDLEYLVDTVHFTDSHHSRMLQLADLYVWLSQLCVVSDKARYPQSELIQHIREHTNILAPSRYKNWPTDASWYQVA